jgi:D-serine deaminase-like pyridoxal phosphate-dependent protein
MAWQAVDDLDLVDSPGLLVDPDRVADNVRRMIEIVGGRDHVGRLRPHVKTHKMADVVALQREQGIDRFKTATLAEAEMVAAAGGSDVLIAHQLVGPKLDRMIAAIKRYRSTSFSAIVDDVDVVRRIAERLDKQSQPLSLLVDIDCGMGRTGVPLGPQVDQLRELIESCRGVRFGGLHLYDGHLHQSSADARSQSVKDILRSLRRYLDQHPVPAIVGGGSPTFVIWARQTDWQCSPGTTVFWDVGYAETFPELPFVIAAAMVCRVISKPGPPDHLCLDLGYKAISAEMPLERRVTFPALPDAKAVSQSEEHLVVSTASAGEFKVGDAIIALPGHICPTVALHRFATLVRNGKATTECWPVTARDR